ncbi:MAG: hypothetical protein K8R36_07295 [Planctomycetales bacterium]|nr:hypothetical protein [Planctomycetales bacterium]
MTRANIIAAIGFFVMCAVAYGTVTILSPSAGPPKDYIYSDHAIMANGTVSPDNGSVHVWIRETGQTSYYDVNISADPTDGTGMWGNTYQPNGGAGWRYLGEHVIVVSSGSDTEASGAARYFDVIDPPVP